MLIAFRKMRETTLEGIDGNVGTINDVYFDVPESPSPSLPWSVRYLVVDTGNWLPGRNILVSPAALIQRDWAQSIGKLALTRPQVEEAPDIDLVKPVSRQMEIELARHYDWPIYWGAVGSGSAEAPPVPPTALLPPEQQQDLEHHLPNLRSARAVRNYSIEAIDGTIGHVEDFIIDDENWLVRYVVVDTKNWRPGRKVLVSPQWVEAISWANETVQVNLPRESIKASPEYDPQLPIDRQYEEQLYESYGRQGYWHGSQP